jgi:Lon protease-like protein
MKPWDAAELEFDAATFCGVARLFPLPNVVLYPHVMQPLHIFEERYREMLEDALAGDKLIAMAMLEPGWEADYDSRPPISPDACGSPST